MTHYAIARPAIVHLVEAVEPTTKEHGLGSEFKHDPKGGGDLPVSGTRRFWMEWRAAHRVGPAQMVASFVVYDVVLVVEYKTGPDRAAFDAAIAEDYEALSLALQTPRNWQPSTTTRIRLLGQGNGDAVFSAEVVDVDGGKRLRIPFPVEVGQ